MKNKFRLLERFFKYYLVESPLTKRKKFLTKMTPINQVESLLESLYPLDCQPNLIRLGPEGDGGYLIPDDLEGINACFSPGVSTASGFEKECATRNIKVFLADKSVNAPAENDDLFSFVPKFIGSMNNNDFITLDHWIDLSIPDSNNELLLQMDIERSEYEVFHSLSERNMKKFRIMVIEFHGLDQIWNLPFFEILNRVFVKILQTHCCVHIHPNNITNIEKLNGIETAQAMEFTFFRKDRIINSSYQNSFPHPLDRDNDPNEASIILPSSWYSN